MNEILTVDQQRIFDIIENTDANILVHGKPGVGKTVLIRALKEFGQKSYTIGAPTGLAALNGGGKTLHSIFGIPISDGILAPDFNKYTNNPNIRNFILHKLHHLIIDEISMVRADVLDYIDRLLRDVKQSDLPFGGVQIIAVGDFFQLPPIVKTQDRKDMQAVGYKSEFAFDAFCFKSFKSLILSEVLRQKGDDNFIKILHASRTGQINEAGLKVLNARVEPCTDFRIRLTATIKQSDAVNQQHLAAIQEPAKEYSASSFGTWPAFPAETVLSLKVGAQVLIKVNRADRPPNAKGPFESKVVNGSLGIITELPEDEPTRVMVELSTGEIVPVYRARWEQKVKEKIGEQWTERVVAAFEQIPIQLAWAISMHKSQGQSFEFVHVDPSSIFAAGQLYVALSRARSLAGLSLQSPASKKSFWTNQRVIEFVSEIERQSELEKV